MAANKTTATSVSVADFLATVKNPTRRADAERLTTFLEDLTDEPPTMWGPSIIGFGNRHYRYESGREGDTPAVSFAPRSTQLVFYINEATGEHRDLLEKIGPHTTGKGCVYVKKLDAIDLDALATLVKASLAD